MASAECSATVNYTDSSGLLAGERLCYDALLSFCRLPLVRTAATRSSLSAWHDRQSQLPEKDICGCDSALRPAEWPRRKGRAVQQKIEKENRRPQRSAGYITKEVIRETSNRVSGRRSDEIRSVQRFPTRFANRRVLSCRVAGSYGCPSRCACPVARVNRLYAPTAREEDT